MNAVPISKKILVRPIPTPMIYTFPTHALAGLNQQRDPAACKSMLRFALSYLDLVRDFVYPGLPPIQVRVGLQVGPVAAGVIGSTKRKFTVLGATVNQASRLESTGVPAKVQVSEKFAGEAGLDTTRLEAREVYLKGVGLTKTFIIDPLTFDRAQLDACEL